MDVILKRISSILHSRRFFWVVLVFFIIEAAWTALSAAYPQAFDEDFHFGIIKVYSHYWLPFLNSQPPHADAFGAVFRDPSYLYHYTMSFPYRLTTVIAHSQTTQVIILRFINIALAATGLVIFHRVLLHARVSRRFTNLSLALFVFIPIVPQVAGQINYDNLLFPLIAWACLLAMQATDELKKHTPSTYTLLTLAIVCTVATMVKYEFLPIALGIVLFLAYTGYRCFRGDWRHLWNPLRQSWFRQSFLAQLALVILLVVSLGLFIRRDGVNLVKYHSFTPDCSKVLSVQACSAYGPWQYSYQRHQDVKAKEMAGEKIKFDNPIIYTGWWVYWLWYRSFFAVDGSAHSYRNYPPLPLPAAAAIIIGVAGVIAILVAILRRRLFGDNPYLLFFCTVVVIYLATLWAEGFLQYHKTDVKVLMNGRYILPVLLLIAVIIGRAVSPLLHGPSRLKISLATLALLFFIQGGGVFTFILRSDHDWYWPNSPAVGLNDTARKVLKPVIIEGQRTYDTRVWIFN
jgi:hypothetical protein